MGDIQHVHGSIGDEFGAVLRETIAENKRMKLELELVPPPCTWNEHMGFDEDYWQTGCDNAFTFITEGPVENHFKFCPYCGGKLVIVKREEPSYGEELPTV